MPRAESSYTEVYTDSSCTTQIVDGISYEFYVECMVIKPNIGEYYENMERFKNKYHHLFTSNSNIIKLYSW